MPPGRRRESPLPREPLIRPHRPVSRLARGVATSAVLVAAACGDDGPSAPAPPPDPTATLARVSREVFVPSCATAGCHAGSNPALSLSLEPGSAWAGLVGVPSAESRLLRVAPGDPNASFLVTKIRADGELAGAPMPPDPPRLSASQVRLVIDWVRRGAPND